jgi:peptide chain release factor subunit 1
MTPQLEQISAQLDRLATLEPSPFPVVSLYLDLRPNQNGRDQFEPFLRKEMGNRLRTYEADGPQRRSLDQDFEKIRTFVSGVDPSANGLALFASSGSDLFEAQQLAAPVSAHRLSISDRPHLYPLARLLDQYPRYAVLHADTHQSRIFVVAANVVEKRQQIEGTKTKRMKMGGWSQARYQRHVDNDHLQHIKEVVDALANLVRHEGISSIVIAGDEVAVPMVKAQLPKHLADCVVDIVKVPDYVAERELLEAASGAMQESERLSERERVEMLLDAYRADALAVVGIEETSDALERGQVDELFVSAAPEGIDATSLSRGNDANGNATGNESRLERTAEERIGDELIAKARQTGARLRFIGDPSLLAAVGGVGARLRFRS